MCWADVVRLRRPQDELGAGAVQDGGDGVGPPAAGRLPEEGETPRSQSVFVSVPLPDGDTAKVRLSGRHCGGSVLDGACQLLASFQFRCP